jgi:hypothetical protein
VAGVPPAKLRNCSRHGCLYRLTSARAGRPVFGSADHFGWGPRSGRDAAVRALWCRRCQACRAAFQSVGLLDQRRRNARRCVSSFPFLRKFFANAAKNLEVKRFRRTCGQRSSLTICLHSAAGQTNVPVESLGCINRTRGVSIKRGCSFNRQLVNVAAFQLGEKAPEVHGFFSSHSFWKRGSERSGSQIGSSLKRAGVMFPR